MYHDVEKTLELSGSNYCVYRNGEDLRLRECQGAELLSPLNRSE